MGEVFEQSSYFSFDSPSDNDVATLEPGCEMKNGLALSDHVGSIKHSCSCPHMTKSKNSSRKFSGI